MTTSPINNNDKVRDLGIFLGLFVLACLILGLLCSCCPPRDYTKLQRSIQPILVDYEEWLETAPLDDDEKAAREFNVEQLKKTIGLDQPATPADGQ